MKKLLFAFIMILMITKYSHSSIDPIAYPSASQTEIPRYLVTWMYTMRVRFWEDGQKITVYNLPTYSSTHKNFVRNVLYMSPISYQQTIDRLRNTGNSSNYVIVNSEAEMIEAVRKTPGAIGYISADVLLVSSKGYVRALRIID